MRRVVVTGLGVVSALGTGVEKNWTVVTNGQSGIAPITRFDASDLATQIAGEVKDFNPEDFIDKKEIKKMDLFIQYGLAAATMAYEDSGYEITAENAEMVGVVVGSGLGGLPAIEHYHQIMLERGYKKISPFFIPVVIINLVAGQISMRFGAKGIKVICSGRLGGAEMARTEQYREGRVPLHTLRADIDYGFIDARTTYGIIGVKVFIFKGEILKKNSEKIGG